MVFSVDLRSTPADRTDHNQDTSTAFLAHQTQHALLLFLEPQTHDKQKSHACNSGVPIIIRLLSTVFHTDSINDLPLGEYADFAYLISPYEMLEK